MSKVFKPAAEAKTREFAWRGDSAAGRPGVGAFIPKRVGDALEPEPEPEPEPAADLDAIRKQSFQEGLQAGRNATEKRLNEESARRMAELSQIFGEIASYKSALREEAEKELVELAFSIARRVLRRELSVDPSAVTALVRNCIAEFPSVSVKRVLVHPDDLSLVRQAIGPGIEAAADASISRGGAVLETDQGRLDARIDAQLEEIALGLADA